MEGTRSDGAVSDQLRAELERLIDADQSRLGQVYRGLRRGLSADAIAAELGVSTSNFVWNYSAVADALLSGTVPASPNIAKQAAGRSRALRAVGHVPSDVREFLVALESRLDRHAATAQRPQVARGRPASPAGAPSAARPADDSSRLVPAVRLRLEEIDRSVHVDVLEYRGLLAVRDVEGAFERLLNGGSACAAFRELESVGRLDLTLEQLALELGDTVSTHVRDVAQARLAYYGGRKGRR